MNTAGGPVFFEGIERDATVLGQELLNAKLIKKDVLDDLTKLEVTNSTKLIYLFSQVYQDTFCDKMAFFKMVEVLLQLPPIPASNASITADHISDLAEVLARYSAKWKLIGTALRFHVEDLDRIQASCGVGRDSIKECIVMLLDMWIKREHKYTLEPTQNNLDKALYSQLVGLGAVVPDVRKVIVADKATVSRRLSCYVISSIYLELRTTFRLRDYLCSNIENVKAKENEPFQLEVQVTSNVEKNIKLEYIWEADYPCNLLSTPFLYIPTADIDMDGSRCACTVKYYVPADCDDQLDKVYTIETKAVTLHIDCQLDQNRNKLTKMYLAKSEVPEDTWPPISSKKYVSLALIKQGKINYLDKLTQYTVRNDIDDILQNKEEIDYQELVKNLKSSNVLFIEGRPGSGKTTIVHKITQDWANAPQVSGAIRLLFLVSLRVLNSFNKPNLELSDILQLFKGLETSEELIEKREGKGVCFIFDGLDEYSPRERKNSIIYRIIKKEYLRESIVIVASRPIATARLRRCADKVVEVLGFKQEQIIEYFKYYPFSEAVKPDDLIKYITTHPNIFHMCYLPIHAAMVAFLFSVTGSVPRTETEIYKNFTRFTVMRSVSKNNQILKNVKDIESLGKKKEFNDICQLAFEKIILNEQVLHENEVDQFFKEDQNACLGLLAIDRTADLYGFTKIYSFLHLTFQEHLAACYIASLDCDQQMETIQEHGPKSYMLVVWKFFCGLVEFKGSNIDNRFKLILQKTKGSLFHIQCAYESQEELACTQILKSMKYCIELVEQPSLSVPDFTAIGYVTSKSVLPTKLTIRNSRITTETMYALEAELREKENIVKIQAVHSLNNEMLKGFVAVLSHCKNLKVLDVSNNELGDIGADTLATELKDCKCLEKIIIANNNMSAIGVNKILHCFKEFNYEHSILTTLQTQQSSLKKTTLEINYEDVRQESVSSEEILYATANCLALQSLVLVRTLNSRAYKIIGNLPEPTALQVLVLKGGVMNDNDTCCLADGLSHCTNLMILDLSESNLGDGKAQIIFGKLQNCGKVEEINLCNNYIECRIQHSSWFQQFNNLKKLDVSKNKISAGGVKALLKHLLPCPNLLELNLDDNSVQTAGVIEILKQINNLEELHLQNNRIGNEGAKVLSFHLKLDCRSYTQRLSLMGNEIGLDGIRALTESFVQCPNLQELDLSSNNIGVAGIKLVIESLKCCSHIKKLYFNHCKLADMGANILSLHIQDYKELQNLSLTNNNISREGIKALAQSFSQCSNLEKLDLSGNSVGGTGISLVMESLTTRVESLCLNSTEITDEGAKVLSSHLKDYDKLLSLSLMNNKISSKALVKSLNKCSNLLVINLSMNNFGIAEIRILSQSLKCTSCKELYIADNNIEDQGVEVLLSCLVQCNLKGLDLSNNNIIGSSSNMLANSLKQCTDLNWLNLSGNFLDPNAALTIIAGINQCPSFRELYLCRNRILNPHLLSQKVVHKMIQDTCQFCQICVHH